MTIRRIVSLALGLAAIGGAELTARYLGFGDPPLVILDEKIEYYLAPSRSYSRFGHEIRVNRYGMRSDDYDTAVADRRINFSLLGDSAVYGTRLNQTNTLSAELQRTLVAKHKDQRVLVNNISASSWGPENLLEFYRRFGPFRGSAAWVVQSTHDMTDVIDLVGNTVPYRTATPYCALHDLAISIWRWFSGFRPHNNVESIGYEDKRHRADKALDALIMTLKRDYAHVTLVFHATREEAISGKAAGLDHYRTVAKEHGIYFLSTIDLYTRAYRNGHLPHYDNIHLSYEGVRILSAQLAADSRPVDHGD